MKIRPSSRRHHYLARASVFLITVVLIAGMAGCSDSGNDNPPPQEGEIRTWYDLDEVRDNAAGNHTLMNDLDSTTAGYDELASPTANEGTGWQPIGASGYYRFTGSFDGQGYEIRDLFINRPNEGEVGLFCWVDEGGCIEDIGLVNATVTGQHWVGGLVGVNIQGTVYNSYSNGNVTGDDNVGGLVGWNSGTVGNSYSTGNVTGQGWVGGLVGYNDGTVYNSYSTGSVSGNRAVGGLVGANHRPMTNSYSTGNVSGEQYVGGLVGENTNDVSNSYSTGSVSGTGGVGGLVGANIRDGTVSDSFWDTETSGQATSDGGVGKNTTEMQDINTFMDTETEGLDEPWDITTVADPGTRVPSYIWNIVDAVTYPFLSWQP